MSLTLREQSQDTLDVRAKKNIITTACPKQLSNWAILIACPSQ
jgi:hypothetical protein